MAQETIVLVNDLSDRFITAENSINHNFDELYAAVFSGITDGDRGDIVVSGGGMIWTIDTGVVTNANLAGGIAPSKIATDSSNRFVTDAEKATWNAAEANAKAYADGLVIGLWDDRGSFDASVNAYPSSGGSGTAGAILKGDIWTVSVAGTLPTGQVVERGDTVRALIDTPGNSQANWAILQNNIGYVPENAANKATDFSVINDTKYPTTKAVDDFLTAFFLRVYPVGCIYESVNSANPSTLFGGTWTAFGAGRVTVGIDAGQTEFDTVEETGGAKTHTLSTAEIPAHTHTYTKPGTPQATLFVGVNADAVNTVSTDNTGSTGGGGAHNNLQPYIVVYRFKRTA